MKLQILPSAIEDLDQGWNFYEEQMAGLGDDFQDSLFSDIESLVLFPGVHLKVFGYHRLLAKRFPFAVYYQIDNQHTITVFRVLDMRQDPKSIMRKLKPENGD